MLHRHAFLTRALSDWQRPRNNAKTWPSARIYAKQWASTRSGLAADSELPIDKRRHSTSRSSAENGAIENQDAVPQKRKRGRPRKDPLADEETHERPHSAPGLESANTNCLSRPRSHLRRASNARITDLPPRLTASTSPHHHDLSSFLTHAARAKVNTSSNVYKGTHYEYTCIETLSSKDYNFELHRTGRANDLGIDLVGYWKVPDWPSPSTERHVEENKQEQNDSRDEETAGKRKRKLKAFRNLKVIAQCKALAPTPSMIRELEGAYIGAPSGWNSSSNVLAFLIASGPATKGTLAALQRSRWPMGMLQITREGEVKQFVWNAVAAESGLGGLGVVVRYSQKRDEEGKGDGGVAESVRLSWMGRVWKA